jgi:hypothetical protein
MLRCLASWKKYCPEYEIRLWNESTFDIEQNRFIREASELRQWAHVTDYVRLAVVYQFGGIYLDTDVELIKSFDNLINNYAGFAGFEHDNKIATGLGFGAEKGNHVINLLKRSYENISLESNSSLIFRTPCPLRDSEVFKSLGFRLDNTVQVIDDFILLPTSYLCPKSYVSGITDIRPETISIHHYNESWRARHRRYFAHVKRVIFRKSGYRI